ncbi:unnamed protein product [Agarophyton chilense]
MKTVSSTTDVASTTSQGMKRQGNSGGNRKSSKRRTDSRNANPSQFTEKPPGQPLGAMGSSAATALQNNIVRQNTPADVLSADNRSSRTNPTNTTSGVQETSSRRRRTPRPENSPATSMVNSRPGIGAAVVHQPVPTPLHASSTSHIPRTPRGTNSLKKQRVQTNNAVAAAAAAAAAATNLSHPLHSRQMPLKQSKHSFPMDMTPQVLANMGMANSGDRMSQLGFVHVMGVPNVVSSMALSFDRDKAAMMEAVGNPVAPGSNNAAQGLNDPMSSGMFGLHGMDGSNINMSVQKSQGVATMHMPGTSPMYSGPTGERALEAMRRRVDRQFYADGGQIRNIMAMGQSTPGNSSNALGPKTALTTVPSGKTTNSGVNRVVGGIPATPGSQISDSIAFGARNMINTAVSMGPLQPGLPLGAPRTSAAESQTSTRVTRPKQHAHNGDATNPNILDNGNNIANIGTGSLDTNGMGSNAAGMGSLPAGKLPDGAVGSFGATGVSMNVMGGNDQILSSSTVGPQTGSIPAKRDRFFAFTSSDEW